MLQSKRIQNNRDTKGQVNSQLFPAGGGNSAESGPKLRDALQRLCKKNPWPKASLPCNLSFGDYCSVKQPIDSLRAGFALGQFRYTDDGTTTTVSDFYDFASSNDDWNGGTEARITTICCFMRSTIFVRDTR
jgi:hypothetical protein